MKKKSPEVRFQKPEARRIGFLMSDAEVYRRVKAWTDEDHAKLLALCKRYGIKDSSAMFYELSLALAREWYPQKKEKGVTKWTGLAKGMLVVEIERRVKPGDPARGATWAAKQLAMREPWKSIVGKDSDPTEALRKVYQTFKNEKWARTCWNAFEWHKHQGTLAEWDASVADVVNNPHGK